MPSLEQNLTLWGDAKTWERKGDEWSHIWGGPEAQWFYGLYPRIHSFLPAQSILEIAPGYGRWTQFLKDHCDHLTIVDLTPNCIEACQERFQSEKHIEYHINDGKSLEMIPNNSIDFVFSFDSLVHVEADVIEVYLNQIATKLKPNGIGFIHHSNFGSLVGKVVNEGWRAESMSRELFEAFCGSSGLQCLTQETINWWNDELTDCISMFTPKGSKWARTNRLIANGKFMDWARHTRDLFYGYFIAEELFIGPLHPYDPIR